VSSYHELAGTRVDRIAGLSDALYAIALTLTVLEVRLPEPRSLMSERDLIAAITPLLPRVLTYLLSFMTLGIFWVGDQTFLHHLHRSDRTFSWLHLGLLAAVAIMPVSTGLLANYITYRTAVVFYTFNLLMIGFLSIVAIGHARRAGLVSGRAGEAAATTLHRRLMTGQILYVVGAALCLIHTYWSIAFILFVQAYFAFWPGKPSRRHLAHHATPTEGAVEAQGEPSRKGESS